LYNVPLVPAAFNAPVAFEGEGFRLRPLNYEVMMLDYEAVMKGALNLTNADREDEYDYSKFTLQDEIIEVGWHTGEWRRRHSFAYSVMSSDNAICYGSLYINPTRKRDYDAEAVMWVTPDAPPGLDGAVYEAVKHWLQDAWPFSNVGYPGRATSFADWDKLGS
jgi:hypothetical protein